MKEVYIISSTRIEKVVIKSKQGEFYTTEEENTALCCKHSVKSVSTNMHPELYELFH